MSIKRTVIGIGMAMAMLTNWARAESTPVVFLSVSDTALFPGEGRYLTLRLNNTVKVGGFGIALGITDPGKINFTPNGNVDTTLPHWRYFIDCSPPPCHPDSDFVCPDTCFVPEMDVITAGTRCSGFAAVAGRLRSEVVAEITGVASTVGDPGPVLQPGNGVLFQVPLTVFPISDSVPLAQRQIQIQINPDFTFFSDSTGNVIYRYTNGTLAVTNGTVTIPFSMKGDLNFDGIIDATDVVGILNYVFLGSPEPVPSPSVADVNCDGIVDSSDVVLLLNKVFLGIPFPC